MNLKDKLNLLEEVLDIEKDTLTENTILEETEEWDSIAIISVIAMFDSDFGKEVSPDDIKNAKIVRDITDLME